MPVKRTSHSARWRQFIGLLSLFIVVIMTVAGLAYLAGGQGITNGDRQLVVELTGAVPPGPGTAVARYFQLDPVIVAYLDAMPANVAVAPPVVNGVSLPPLGAYLPRTGNVGTTFDTPDEPLPTPRPYNTGTPFPLPTTPPLATIPPTLTAEIAAPTAVPPVAAAVVAPDGACAPAGLPVSGLLTQYFHTYHIGIDLGTPLGSPVYATHTGTVNFADWSDIGYGYLVIIRSGTFITYYGHNTSLNVVSNQQVNKGDIIAWSGSTGNSTGPHVHYETRINDVPVDPLTFESRGYAGC